MRLAPVALATLTAVPVKAAVDNPDVALTVRMYEGQKLVASANTKGQFGERLVVRKDNLMQVHLLVDAPDAEG